MKEYVQYIFHTCIFFHYLSSDKQALPNTLSNNSVCVGEWVYVCVYVCERKNRWEVFLFANMNTQ